MVERQLYCCIIVVVICFFDVIASAQQMGSVRGMVFDADFDAPLPLATIEIVETGERVMTTEEGNYVFGQVPSGTYTLVFSKTGYVRQLKADVIVVAGQMTEVDGTLSGEFEEMEEFIVQVLDIGGTEVALLELRIKSPAMMDSIGSDLMGQAGAGDAASALKLVTGATVQDGKFAVIRGLPDRYVSSQMNGVRLPTADTDKRAVELDQFPSAVIESIQVSKSFTPDQQGDASGGAVNVVLKGIPSESIFKFSFGTSINSQVIDADNFLVDSGGGVNFLGMDNRDIPSDGDFTGPVGVSGGSIPWDYKWSLASGGTHEFDSGFRIGGFANVYYERDSSFFDRGIDDSYWVETPGADMTPQYSRGTPTQGDFKTSLFDVTEASEEVKWGGLGVLGIENEEHELTLVYMYTRTAESTATLAEDTRGKAYYFPGYDPDDPTDPGNENRDAAPYLRTETLEYMERTTQTFQLAGNHIFEIDDFEIADLFVFQPPEFDWTVAYSIADMYQPNKRQFGSLWLAEYYDPGFPPWIPPFTAPEVHRPYKPAANFTLGNLQRIWKDITEESNQYFFNIKFPFEQWDGEESYLKFGMFHDKVDRKYNQDSFSNFNDNSAQYEGPFEDYWSEVFPSENHPVTTSEIDVDYDGEQEISAWYYMVDFPLTPYFKVIGGARYETTEICIVNFPEEDVTWIPPGAVGAVKLNPGDADVMFEQKNTLPSIGFVFEPTDQITLRGSYSKTVARQTFKELTPIQQQEYLGGDVFIGNPELQMSALDNYDLRLDYEPYEDGLISFSWFYKKIKDPIEYVQRIADFAYTTPVNYPEGTLQGIELEVRQNLGCFWHEMEGFSIVANATFINSEVTLPNDEIAGFNEPNIMAPMRVRDMTNAPEYLYNLYLMYELEDYGTKIGLFYTVKGDTLVAGAGQSSGNFVPNVYEKEYGTLNFSISKKIGDSWNLKFQAKNLLNPKIERVYRSGYINGDVTKSSYRKGIEFSITLSVEF